jgi:hypothetical protein
MKTALLIALNLLLTGFMTAGDDDKKIKVPFDSTTSKYAYNLIFNLDTSSSKTLYQRTKKWYIDKYSKGTFLNDVENSSLTQTGEFDISAPLKAVGKEYTYTYKCRYEITSKFKDGKCKLEITNFHILTGASDVGQTLEAFKKSREDLPVNGKNHRKHVILCFEEIDKMTTKIIQDFESNIKQTAKSKDW